MMSLLLLIVLMLFLVGGLSRFDYHSYGYAPSGFVGGVGSCPACVAHRQTILSSTDQTVNTVSQLPAATASYTAQQRFERAAYLHITTHL